MLDVQIYFMYTDINLVNIEHKWRRLCVSYYIYLCMDVHKCMNIFQSLGITPINQDLIVPSDNFPYLPLPNRSSLNPPFQYIFYCFI